VLTVDVESMKGKPATYVLDSHFEHVEPWQVLNQYGYYWLERSKPGSSEWARLDGGSAAGTVQIASLSTMIMPASPAWNGDLGQVVRVKAYASVMGGWTVSPAAPLQLALDTHMAMPDVAFDARVDSHARMPVQQASVEQRDEAPTAVGQTYKISYVSSR
jgi:hypothetical protein